MTYRRKKLTFAISSSDEFLFIISKKITSLIKTSLVEIWTTVRLQIIILMNVVCVLYVSGNRSCVADSVLLLLGG